jgi:hypothetical protein
MVRPLFGFHFVLFYSIYVILLTFFISSSQLSSLLFLSLEILRQTLSKDVFSQVLSKFIDDCVATASQKPTSLIFEIPPPTVNSTE